MMGRMLAGWPRFTLAALAVLSVAAAPHHARAGKEELSAAVAARAERLWASAHRIWEWAEPGFQEEKSSAELISLLEPEGFKIERGVAAMPTAFTATFGSGSPVIGILGEFDALPGLSQQAVPYRVMAKGTNFYGHACGHHLFGAASAGAALALAEEIRAGRLKGTIRFYGTPAEEGGRAKVFMASAGLFDDCDAVLHWHPRDTNAAGDAECLAVTSVKFRFHGKSTHAAAAPEQGRSALDAVALTNYAAELMREHTPEFTRIHHVITAGGLAPNVVPDFAEVYYYVRHPEADVVRSLYARLVKCAEAGALATETELEIVNEGGTWGILPNKPLASVVLKNLRELNDLEYTAEETKFAEEIQKTIAEPKPLESIKEVKDVSGTTNKGSTDVGDVSWRVPTAGFGTACWAPGTPAHSWQAVAAGGTTLGRKGMLLAARVLAASAWDIMNSPETIEAAKKDFAERRAKKQYAPLLEPGQAPPLDYRNPSQPRAGGEE